MALRIILPAKPFAEAKQRLASAMTAEARAHLAEQMFRHVLAIASAFAEPAAIIVVSRAPDILCLAQTCGATALAEKPPCDLNIALRQAAKFALDHGASKLLVVAGDLPLLCKDDLAALAAHDCAIAPDRRGRGTNALLWPPSLEFHFGDNSFERHCVTAKLAGYEARIVVRSGLAHDVDLPSDIIKPVK
ncbi:MAG TPA: 2-phospho-L-lactate guanylyltransferase [Rhizomicrobium sp.]|nr:2-phospho-L-lactate guanylyltransferase [Rhizomicrobium sp.]